MFKFHTSFALGLIAMVAGTYLIARISSEGACCKGFAKVVGWFVVVTAFLVLICSTYCAFNYWSGGKFDRGMMGRGKHMMHHGKCMHMMKGCPNMKEMVEKCPQLKGMMEEEESEKDD